MYPESYLWISSHADSASTDESPGTPLCGPAIVAGLIRARPVARDLLCEAGILVEGHGGYCLGMNSDGGRSKRMCMGVAELLPEEIGEKAKRKTN